MKRSLIHTTLILLLGLLLTGCHVSQYVPQGSHVLHTTSIDMQMADSSALTPEVRGATARARSYMVQKPNSKLLGIEWLPVSKWVYGIAAPQDSTLWGRYWRRLGQQPVVYDPASAQRTAKQLQQLLDSKGCFGSAVSFDTTTLTRHNIGITYHIRATQRYTIDEVNYITSNDAVRRLLEEWRSASPLQPGQPYDQEHIAAERARIVANLREAGYFRASQQLVTFRVDTTYSSTQLGIDVLVDSRVLQVYHINNIFVYPNSTAGLRSATQRYDTLIYTYPSLSRRIDYQYVYSEPMRIKPQTISRALMLFPGMTYRPRYVSASYNSLLGLRNFKYINIEFEQSPSSTDSLPLVDAHVRLIDATQQRLSLSLELTNASPLGSTDSTSNFFNGGNLGVETSMEYQHKNLFGGAELLKVKGSLILELPKLAFNGAAAGFRNIFSTFEENLEVSLDMPIFLLPGSQRFTRVGMRPHTLFALGVNYQYRSYYERGLANASFGYTWAYQRTASHQVLPVDMTFVSMFAIDDAFAARLTALNDMRLKYQYSSHFILAARYDYTYSNQQFGTRANFTALHLSVESAGNLLSAVGYAVGAQPDSAGVRRLIDVPYAQYVRLGGEWTRYFYHGSRSTFVARVLAGVGIPYGNSFSMPYEKSFYGGGPTTMRAWQLRHLGPGSYRGSEDMLERVGDLQLVVNLEERFPLFSIFEGALFADMGNVWLLNPSAQYPGGEIKLGSLPTEVAVGVGLGLRVNVSIATLRVDFALPMYDPGYATQLRWRPPHWTLRQVVTCFGINYPF